MYGKQTKSHIDTGKSLQCQKKLITKICYRLARLVLDIIFYYTGPSLSAQSIERQVNYCIDCHFKQNDSCSKGLNR